MNLAGKILVTGANGNIGTLLVPALAKRRESPIVALVRDASKGKSLSASGAEVREGSFEDTASLTAAMDKVDTVVLIAPAGPDCVEQNAALIDAAAQSGVRKIVRISAIRAAEDGRTENTRLHGTCDRLLQESGLAYVILRPNYFMQNLFMSLDSIREQDMFVAGMGDGRFAMIDVRDVADSAAAAATSVEFDNQVFELSGPASISFHDVAEAVSEAAGRPVAYVAVAPDDVKAALLGMGMDEWMADLLREYSEAIGDGWGDLVTENVQHLAGHPARNIDQFVRECLAGGL